MIKDTVLTLIMHDMLNWEPP